MASFFVIRGRDQGRRFELDSEVLSLGRESYNTVQLHDGEVSRKHAEVRREGHLYQLVDLNSSNGTFVNSERVDSRTLRNGDRVQLGRTLMIFTGAESESSGEAIAVDIVSRSADQQRSRIVHSAGPDLAFDGADPSQVDSPWLARARSNLQVMYRTALAVSHTLDIDQLLARIMDLIFEWVEADRGCVMLVDPETDELTPAVRRNRAGVRSDDTLTISRTILDYVMTQNEGVLTSDAREDERWDANAGGSILSLGVREAICVPMQGRYGVVGVIYIDTYTQPGSVLPQRNPNRFSEDHLKLMVAIGHQAALAVEDTSYYSAMVQAERLAAIGQTIATLSHHIKNILQGIRGGSYLIDEGLKHEQTELIRKGWRIVDKNQERISNLVMDMLSFSKEREPQLSDADINETVGDVVELALPRAADVGVTLEWQPAADIPLLQFDPDALHRAVLNIVTNAVDACEKVEGGRVRVSTRLVVEPPQLEIIVEDNGEGIPPDDLERIFSVFESRKGSRGTGLGLPVSRKILREHRGDILVESEPSKGSRFILQLPAIPPGPDQHDNFEFGPGDTLMET